MRWCCCKLAGLNTSSKAEDKMGVVAAIRIRLTIARISLAPETKTRLIICSNGIRNGYDGWKVTDVPAGPHQPGSPCPQKTHRVRNE